MIRPLTALASALLLAAPLAACGDDDSDAEDVPTTSSTTAEAVDEAAGSFELTTSDGSLAVAGTTDQCTISDDRRSVELTFTGSSQDVEVDAVDGAGSVTIVGEFEGTIDSLDVDESGEVAISGRGGVTDDSAAPSTFEVKGTCP